MLNQSSSIDRWCNCASRVFDLMTTRRLPDQINGYYPVPILVRDEPRIFHVIYVRKHHARGENGDDNTVFAVNLPVDTRRENIKSLCQALGNTILGDFEPDAKHRRGLIVLVDKASCTRFLSKAKAQNIDSAPITWEAGVTGSEVYYTRNSQKYPDRDELQQQVDLYMEDFAKAEEEKLNDVKSKTAQVDDEGFTLVVGSKRKSLGGMAAPKIATEELVAELQAKKKRKKEKTDFYGFQIRDQKKTEMNALLKRFQQDRLKVQELKEKRRFKPY